MKKYVSILLAAILSASLLAGCGGSGKSGQQPAKEAQEQAAQQKDVFEAKESGIVFTIPDEFKELKGTIVFEDFGDDIVAGQGHYVQMAGY